MVSIIDMDCLVRHAGFRWSGASNHPVEVFYSPQSLLLRPGTFNKINLVVLGCTRFHPMGARVHLLDGNAAAGVIDSPVE
jgi:hypothetical protein